MLRVMLSGSAPPLKAAEDDVEPRLEGVADVVRRIPTDVGSHRSELGVGLHRRHPVDGQRHGRGRWRPS